MKTICFFTGDITRCGGTERAAVSLANALAERGTYRVLILSLWETARQPFFPLNAGVERHALFRTSGSLKLRGLAVFLRLRRFLKREKADAVIDADVILSLFSLPAAKSAGCACISWEHFPKDENLGCLFRDTARSLAAKYARAVVVLSERDRQLYLADGRTRTRVAAIPNMVPEPPEETGFSGGPGPFLLSAGRLAPEKGFHRIPAIADTFLRTHEAWRWIILGEGPERSRIEEQIRAFHLEGRILLPGRTDPYPYYRRAAVFVMTSKFEGFPMTLLEAMSQGVPAVVYDSPGGSAEIAGNGGCLAAPGDEAGMLREITRLADDPGLRAERSEAAKEAVRGFSKASVTDRWTELFREILP